MGHLCVELKAELLLWTETTKTHLFVMTRISPAGISTDEPFLRCLFMLAICWRSVCIFGWLSDQSFEPYALLVHDCAALFAEAIHRSSRPMPIFNLVDDK